MTFPSDIQCQCGRGPVIAAAFKRTTSLLVRRIGDMGHHAATDWRCVDCIADMAGDVAANDRRSWHPDFGGPGMLDERDVVLEAKETP